MSACSCNQFLPRRTSIQSPTRARRPQVPVTPVHGVSVRRSAPSQADARSALARRNPPVSNAEGTSRRSVATVSTVRGHRGVALVGGTLESVDEALFRRCNKLVRQLMGEMWRPGTAEFRTIRRDRSIAAQAGSAVRPVPPAKVLPPGPRGRQAGRPAGADRKPACRPRRSSSADSNDPPRG